MIDNKNRTAEEAKSVQVAEESREMDWKSKSFIASMYMGDFDWKMAYPFPQQESSDRAIGDAKLAEIEAWAEDAIDAAEIDRTGVIPGAVLQGLAELGLFGIKIPKEYGGLGFSQTNYMRILAAIGGRCGSTAALLSAHQSIGLPQPLKLFGSPEQKARYLPLIAKGAVSAFALTEPSVGSDPANMTTYAELSADGSHWVLSGLKLWCTNGVIADYYVVMARTPSKMVGGKERKQISAFIVDGRAEGVDVLHRCDFMGLKALENGVIRFDRVKVPAEDILWGEGKGLRLALTTLNDGRLGIPAVTAHISNQMAKISADWAKSRVQWGKAVGLHEAGSEKLAFISAGAYAVDTLSAFSAALSDRGDSDIRMEAAAAKMYNTELGWDILDTAIQLRGGRGFETAESLEKRGEFAVPMERAMRDTRINRIIEGTTDIMHLFLAREALDKHLKLAGGLFRKGSIASKIGVVLKAAMFYALWYPKLYVGGVFKSYPGFDRRLAKALKRVDAQTRRLARALFHRMIVMGPKLEARQLTLNRLVDIGVELAVMGLVATRAQTELNQGEGENLDRALHWLKEGDVRVENLFTALGRNSDATARSLAKSLVEGADGLPEIAAPELSALPREFGSDLTSGRQRERLALGGEVPQDAIAKTA